MMHYPHSGTCRMFGNGRYTCGYLFTRSSADIGQALVRYTCEFGRSVLSPPNNTSYKTLPSLRSLQITFSHITTISIKRSEKFEVSRTEKMVGGSPIYCQAYNIMMQLCASVCTCFSKRKKNLDRNIFLILCTCLSQKNLN